MEKNKKIGGLTSTALKMLGCNEEKILRAVEGCIREMQELTIEESKIARKHLDSVMEEMYRRSPDTVIGTIPHSL